jgi:hypothetical protein
MKLLVSGAALILWASLLGAQTPAQQEPTYNGTWVSQKDKDVKLVMQTTGDKIHVQEFKGSEMKWEYTCGLSGKACKFKEGMHEATVSLWQNGPKLVELCTRGDSVTKRRFTLADKGSTLDVEVLPISPPGETQTLAYSRD